MTVQIKLSSRDVPNVRIQVQRLRISKLGIRYCGCFGGPIRRNEAAQSVRVVSGAKIVQRCFCISFLAGELVMVLDSIGNLKFTTPGIIIRFVLDDASRVGNDSCSLQVIGEVIEDAAIWIAACYPIPIEEYIIGPGSGGDILLGENT